MKVYFENGVTVIDTGDSVGGCKNKNGYNGIFYKNDTNKYRATLVIKRKKYFLGDFNNIEDAVAYYNAGKEHAANGTFFEWYQTLYGKTKCIRKASESK